jgi:glycosyltransferase involved in cell wall biosynthesis
MSRPDPTPPTPRLTIICPVYDEEKAVPAFFARVIPVVGGLSARYDVQLVFVNNSSSDRTLTTVLGLRERYSWVHVLSLSRNVGYQRAIECGLRTIDSDLYVIIDVDCEDPPEMIEAFVSSFEEGFDVVYGERVDRAEPRPLKLTRRIYYRIMRAIADDEILLDMAEFSLLTREVRDAVIADVTSFPFIRASIGRVGFRRRAIPYKREARVAGETHYNLFRMVTFAVAGILSASTWLLRMTIYTLPLWMLAAGALFVAALLGADWAVAAMILVIGAYACAALSVIAIYVARIYKNTLGRPNFFIDEKSTFMDQHLQITRERTLVGAHRS